MSDTPSWASGFDSCSLQCLADAIDSAGCSDLSDSACFCKDDALLAMTLNDGLYLCLGLTCDPYLVGTAFQDMITYCAGSGSGSGPSIDDFTGSGTPGSTTSADEGGSTTQDTSGPKRGGGSANNGGGFSAGAKGGIAGGVVGGVLLLLAILFFVFRRRRTAKTSEPAAEKPGVNTAQKRDTPRPGNGVHQRDTQRKMAAWGELGGKELSEGPGSSACGTGSIVELGPTPRPRGSLPGEQSLGYSSVVTELESYPPATTELDGTTAPPSVSPLPAGRALAGGTRDVPDSEGLIPVASTTDFADARRSSVEPSVAASPRSEKDLDRLLRLDEELEERRRTLAEIKEVQARQAAIREQIKGIQER